MSKDKYRPSITDQEVVITRPKEETVRSPSTTGSSGGGGAEGGAEVDAPGGTGPSSRTAPTGLRVLKETVYYSPEGQQLVEVTFGWDDVPGATEYELRVARG